MLVARDLHLELRRLLHEKGFTGLAVGTLTLGIGAAVTVFSALDAVVLRPLPYADPDGLVAVLSTGQEAQDGLTSMGDFVDWREQARCFASMAAMGHGSLVLAEGGEPEEIPTAAVSWNLFEVLGARPLLGRSFLPDEEAPGRDQIVLLSHSLWQRRFGRDPGVVGRQLRLSGAPYLVLGVLPPDFQFLRRDVGFWSPMALDREKLVRKRRGLNVVARLRPGVTIEQAQEEMNTIARRQEERYPETNTGWRAQVVPLERRIVGPARAPLLLLASATGLLLLIACINVANLVQARALVRRREATIRTALGAGRWGVYRGLLAESFLISSAGLLGGLLLAHWALPVLIALSPHEVPRIEQAAVDATAVAFALLAAGIIAAVLSAAAVVRVSGPHASDLLRAGDKSTLGHRPRRTGEVLVAAQVATAFWLLVVSGLLVKSFVRVLDVDPGFKPRSLLVASFFLPLDKYGDESRQLSFFTRLIERVGTLPGVISVASSSAVPLNVPQLGFDLPFAVHPEGQQSREQERRAEIRLVSPGYFRTLGIPLESGRDFEARDGQDTPRVAIVNEELARRSWPGESPIGKRLYLQYRNEEWFEVVGVVGDVHHYALDEWPLAEIYLPYRQHLLFFSSVVVRTAGSAMAALEPVRAVVRELDREQAVTFSTMEENVARSVAERRFTMLLLVAFAAAATALTLVGIHGVMARWVVQRKAEIGVRVALGARSTTILGTVLARGLALTGVGLLAGLAAALGTVRFLQRFLYAVPPGDLAMFSLASVLLLAAALLSCLVPAQAAVRLDPVAALRNE